MRTVKKKFSLLEVFLGQREVHACPGLGKVWGTMALSPARVVQEGTGTARQAPLFFPEQKPQSGEQVEEKGVGKHWLLLCSVPTAGSRARAQLTTPYPVPRMGIPGLGNGQRCFSPRLHSLIPDQEVSVQAFFLMTDFISFGVKFLLGEIE